MKEYLRETEIARKLTLKRKEHEAYLKGYGETKIRLARKKGRRAAKTSGLGGALEALLEELSLVWLVRVGLPKATWVCLIGLV